MEDGLVQTKQKVFISRLKCLNPYCSGRWSRTKSYVRFEKERCIVLILIVMEDGLVQF